MSLADKIKQLQFTLEQQKEARDKYYTLAYMYANDQLIHPAMAHLKRLKGATEADSKKWVEYHLLYARSVKETEAEIQELRDMSTTAAIETYELNHSTFAQRKQGDLFSNLLEP